MVIKLNVLALILVMYLISNATLIAQPLVIFDESNAFPPARGFYSIDLISKAETLLTQVDTTPDRLTGFSYRHADGLVYAGSSSGDIWTIDLSTGQATEVGDTGLIFIRGIVFSPIDGTMYGMGFGPNLYEINPETAEATLLGTVPDLDEGLAAGPDGMLYGITPGTDNLLVIDPVSLSTTTIVSDLSKPLSNLTFTPDGRLFGVNWGSGSVYEINPITGDADLFVNPPGHQNALIGIFSIPEPTSVSLLAMGVYPLLSRRRV